MDDFQKIEVQIINAFVDNGKGGNPAGVVLNADNLSNEQKLAIAKNVGLSETAFVSRSSVADFKLDFFTPTRQIAHCGHATIATFSYLSQLGKIGSVHSSKETIDGTREILIQGELAFMEQRAPRYIDVESRCETILKSLHLTKNDLLTDAPISMINTGNSFVIVPVKSAEVLKLVQPDYSLIEEISDALDLIGYYIFSTDASEKERDATTRMFAPRYGIQEEAGTGMAAGPLACYLYEVLKIKKHRFLIEQGWYMNESSPSLILVDLTINNDQISKIMAGGKGMLIKKVKGRSLPGKVVSSPEG
jgi:PhzF family phenazine biosynthesis protein